MVTTSTEIVDFFGKRRTLYRMTEDELAEVIGQNARAARLHAGLTMAALKEKTGIAVPHLSRLESGKHLPSVATLKKVADALGLPICSFLDPPPEPKKGKK